MLSCACCKTPSDFKAGQLPKVNCILYGSTFESCRQIDMTGRAAVEAHQPKTAGNAQW